MLQAPLPSIDSSHEHKLFLFFSAVLTSARSSAPPHKTNAAAARKFGSFHSPILLSLSNLSTCGSFRPPCSPGAARLRTCSTLTEITYSASPSRHVLRGLPRKWTGCAASFWAFVVLLLFFISRYADSHKMHCQPVLSFAFMQSCSLIINTQLNL